MSLDEKVSIIMPCYNGSLTLAKAIDSVMAQTFKDFLLYIVDDGSTDSSPTICTKYQRLHPDRIKVITQNNQGQTKAKNNALKVAKGDYIAFIDSDDLWHPDKLSQQIEWMEKHPNVGLCYCDGYYIDENDTKQGVIGVDKRYQGACFKQLLMGNAIVASSVVIRKAAIGVDAQFDERLSACENWELWTRIAFDYELHSMQQKLVYYRRHSNNMSLNFEKLRNNRIQVIENNRIYYQQKVDDIQHQTKKALYRAYRFFGENYLWHFQCQQARKDLLKALRLKPLDFGCYALLVKSFLGGRLLKTIRHYRQGAYASK